MVDPVVSGFSQSPMVIDYVRVYQEGTTSRTDLQPENSPKLYPNPVEEELNIELTDDFLGATVSIFSPTGQLLDSWIANKPSLKIEGSNFNTSGIYVVLVENETKRLAYKVLKK